MGKVSRRLTIVVFPPLGEWPEIVKLEEQGHTIIRVDSEGYSLREGIADLIIGPQCWYFDTKHCKYLTSAIKQARLKRYGAPQRKADKKDAESTSTDADVGDVTFTEPIE